MWILGKTSYLLGMMAKVQLFGLIPKPLKRRLSSSTFKIKPAKQSVYYNRVDERTNCQKSWYDSR
jgi:hypothetical protein